MFDLRKVTQKRKFSIKKLFHFVIKGDFPAFRASIRKGFSHRQSIGCRLKYSQNLNSSFSCFLTFADVLIYFSLTLTISLSDSQSIPELIRTYLHISLSLKDFFRFFFILRVAQKKLSHNKTHHLQQLCSETFIYIRDFSFPPAACESA